MSEMFELHAKIALTAADERTAKEFLSGYLRYVNDCKIEFVDASQGLVDQMAEAAKRDLAGFMRLVQDALELTTHSGAAEHIAEFADAIEGVNRAHDNYLEYLVLQGLDKDALELLDAATLQAIYDRVDGAGEHDRGMVLIDIAEEYSIRLDGEDIV